VSAKPARIGSFTGVGTIPAVIEFVGLLFGHTDSPEHFRETTITAQIFKKRLNVGKNKAIAPLCQAAPEPAQGFVLIVQNCVRRGNFVGANIALVR
jgi:hypothetical protein